MNSAFRITRRALLGHTGGLLLCASAAPAFASRGSKFDMGLQLYTVRDPMMRAPVDTLKRIAALGYRNLETYGFDAADVGYYGMPATQFARVLDDLGLVTTSGHYDLAPHLGKPDQMRAYVDRCIEGAHALNQQYITWPWLPPEMRTLDHFHMLAATLNEIGAQVKAAGLKLAYHNHDFEFIAQQGRLGYDILMNDTDPELVKLQLDLYWVHHSSERSPHELFKLQPGRFVMWHVKDMDSARRYTELGHGVIDFSRIMPDAELAGLENYFVEQGDNFAVDPMTSIATSAAYVKHHLR